MKKIKWLLVLLLINLCCGYSAETEKPLEEFCGKVSTETDIFHEEGLDRNVQVPWSATVTVRSETQPDETFPAVIVSQKLLLASVESYLIDKGTKRFRIEPFNQYLAAVGTPLFGDPLQINYPVQTFKISHIRIHPNFQENEWQGVKNNMMLLHLTESLNLSAKVTPICLPSNFSILNTTLNPSEENLLLFGWNRYEPQNIFLRLSSQSQEKCKEFWDNEDETKPYPYENRVCALVGKKNNHTKCIHKDTTAAVSIGDKYYFAGIGNNLYSNNKTRMCSQGALYYFMKNSLETFTWIQNNTRCGSNKFTCSNGDCIPLAGLCNQTSECSDKSDERADFCRGLNFCTANEFPCGVYGKCISIEKRLDGNKDCENGEDEIDPNPPKAAIGLYVGLSGGALVVILLLAILLPYIKHLRGRIRDLTDEEVNDFKFGSRSSIKSQNSSTDYLKPNANIATVIYVNDTIQTMPWNSGFEIPLNHLDIQDEINRGNFGIVYKALHNNAKGKKVVAIKIPMPTIGVDDFKALLGELKILAHVGSNLNNENVIKFFGACTEHIKKKIVYLVVEYCPKGDLRNFLVDNAKYYVDLFKPRNTSGPDYMEMDYFSTKDLIKWLSQIASGMAYLSSRQVVHGDLAARNVLISENFDAKISDFGLSREYGGSGIYIKTSRQPVAFKWSAIEVLRDNILSEKSDAFAMGVTMWEMFTLGLHPYPDKRWSMQFLNDLLQGIRLPKPQYASDEIYRIMLSCWENDPESRPNFICLQNAINLVNVPNSFTDG